MKTIKEKVAYKGYIIEAEYNLDGDRTHGATLASVFDEDDNLVKENGKTLSHASTKKIDAINKCKELIDKMEELPKGQLTLF
ncbi:hypothetical protein [Eubacterium oxidoreducens]|uniref:Uncharacterized protein n=1 Tax=Eubacterium oxidoreducens TaxID=1732 RepID=A0A1G6B341_EUBOX|nr:hypothetical protein [Eubacterium oxidoreducens]SDB15015.1 hypothetical protein SAMN02910417_01102 [Eubacterium oxidoreducens]